MKNQQKKDEPVLIWNGRAILEGVLTLPRDAQGVVAIPGIGGTFHHERVRSIAAEFIKAGYGALIADLLTEDEQQFDSRTAHFRSNANLLASRIQDVVRWLQTEPPTRPLPVALFSGSTTAAACLAAAADLSLAAVVLAGPRFDAIRPFLTSVRVPALIIFDERPTSKQLRDLADAAFGGSVMTLTDAALIMDDDRAARLAADAAVAFCVQRTSVAEEPR